MDARGVAESGSGSGAMSSLCFGDAGPLWGSGGAAVKYDQSDESMPGWAAGSAAGGLAAVAGGSDMFEKIQS